MIAFPILGMLIKDTKKKKRFERFENVFFFISAGVFLEEIN